MSPPTKRKIRHRIQKVRATGASTSRPRTKYLRMERRTDFMERPHAPRSPNARSPAPRMRGRAPTRFRRSSALQCLVHAPDHLGARRERLVTLVLPLRGAAFLRVAGEVAVRLALAQ